MASGEWRAESPVQFLIQTDLTPLLGLPEPCDISINFDFFCFRAFFLSPSLSACRKQSSLRFKSLPVEIRKSWEKGREKAGAA